MNEYGLWARNLYRGDLQHLLSLRGMCLHLDNWNERVFGNENGSWKPSEVETLSNQQEHLAMEYTENEPPILCNQERLPFILLGQEPNHKMLNLQAILPARYPDAMEGLNLS